MAKLVLILSLASWLMFAHDVIDCTKSTSSASNLLTKLFSSQRKHPRDRTDEDWREQTKKPYNELSKTIKEYQTTFGQARRLKWFDNAQKWLDDLKRISPQTDCTEQLQNNLLELRESGKMLKNFYALLNDYLELYLEVCGFEERFKKVIRNLEPIVKQNPDLTEHPSLYLYLNEFSPAKRLANILSTIKGLSELGRIPEEIDCSKEHVTKLLGWLEASNFFDGWREFVYDYFALFLEKCGLESVYRKALGHPNSKPTSALTVYTHIRHQTWVREVVERLLFAMQDIFELDRLPGVSDCSEELEAFFSESRDKIKHHPALRELLMDQYFPTYLEKCGFEARFKKVVANIQQAPNHSWTPTAYPTLLSCLEGERSMKDMGWIPSAIKELSELNLESKKTLCTDELLGNLIDWRVKSKQLEGLRIIMRDSFALYLDQCGLEQSFEERIGSMDQKSDDRQAFSKHLTLFSYVENKNWNRSMLIGVLSIMRKLSESISIFKETDCTKELGADIIEWLVTDRDYQGMLPKKYFEFYLDKCGFEYSFKIVIKTIEQETGQGWDWENRPTLYSQLTSDPLSSKFDLTLVLSDFKKLSELESMSRDTDSAKKLMEDLMLRSKGKLQMFVRNYLETKVERI